MKDTEFYVGVADGVKYYLVERYEDTVEAKKAVLLVHGGSSGYVIYDIRIKDYSIMNYLARKGFVVYAVDLRGFGKSTRTSGLDVRAETCAEDLRSIVDFITKRLAIGKIGLAGGSFGSMVASIYAAKYPTNLERLALMSVPYKMGSSALKESFQPMLDLINKGAGYAPTPSSRDSQKTAGQLHSSDLEVLSYFIELSTSHCPQIPLGIALDFIKSEVEGLPHDHYIPLITTPTLVITGANDELCPVDKAQQLYKDLLVQEKKIVLVPNAHHRTFLELEGHLPYMQGLQDWFMNRR